MTQCLKSFENIMVFLLESDKADDYLLYPIDLAEKFYAPLARHWTKSSNAQKNKPVNFSTGLLALRCNVLRFIYANFSGNNWQ